MLVITPGDPAGIGPEVTVKALAERLSQGEPVDAVLIGDAAVLRAEAARVGLAVYETSCVDHRPRLGIGLWEPSGNEPVEVRAIRAAVAACRSGRADALVTGPIHKGRLAARGFAFPGHTDFLGHLCSVDNPVMAFVGGSLRVALVTVHLPLRNVADAIAQAGVEHVLRTVSEASRTQLGLEAPRIAVCGLNPHAGDGGLLGREEIEHIAPAVKQAVADGIDARGPVSAEAAFRQAADGKVDWVIAMYHDQGLAPLKLVDFGRSVNWTLGLPMVRTSVDHGTADDIAGKGIADPSAMLAAIAHAERLIR